MRNFKDCLEHDRILLRMRDLRDEESLSEEDIEFYIQHDEVCHRQHGCEDSRVASARLLEALQDEMLDDLEEAARDGRAVISPASLARLTSAVGGQGRSPKRSEAAQVKPKQLFYVSGERALEDCLHEAVNRGLSDDPEVEESSEESTAKGA